MKRTSDRDRADPIARVAVLSYCNTRSGTLDGDRPVGRRAVRRPASATAPDAMRRRARSTNRASTRACSRGQRRPGRVVRRRLVGHRRPHRRSSGSPTGASHAPIRSVTRAPTCSRPSLDPIARAAPTPTSGATPRNVRAHYDLGNELFQRLLDDTMMYSCAIFDSPDDSLADRVARQARTSRARASSSSRGDRVLEIGTGWGGFAIHAARAIRLPRHDDDDLRAPVEYARDAGADAGLDHLVTVREDDYRDVRGDVRQGDRDRDDRSRRLARVRHVLRPVPRPACPTTGLLAMQAIVVPDGSFDGIKHHDATSSRPRSSRAGAFRRSARSPTPRTAAAGSSLDASRRHRPALRGDPAALAGQPRRRRDRAARARLRRAVRPALGLLLLVLRGRLRRALHQHRPGGVRDA